MKWRFNLFLSVLFCCIGFLIGQRTGDETGVKTENNAVYLDIGQYLDNAKCNILNVSELLTIRESDPIFGGQLATVTVLGRRQRELNNSKDGFKNNIEMIDELVTPYHGDLFLNVAPFDTYVKVYWIDKRA